MVQPSPLCNLHKTSSMSESPTDFILIFAHGSVTVLYDKTWPVVYASKIANLGFIITNVHQCTYRIHTKYVTYLPNVHCTTVVALYQNTDKDSCTFELVLIKPFICTLDLALDTKNLSSWFVAAGSCGCLLNLTCLRESLRCQNCQSVGWTAVI